MKTARRLIYQVSSGLRVVPQAAPFRRGFVEDGRTLLKTPGPEAKKLVDCVRRILKEDDAENAA